MDREALRSRLKIAREQAGLTQLQAAKLLSIDSVTLSRYETGERNCSLEIIERLAGIYGVSEQWLTYGITLATPEEMQRWRRMMEGIPLDEAERLMDILKAIAQKGQNNAQS